MRQILLAAANVARDSHFEYDRRTLLVEKQSTNLLTQSDDPLNATWGSDFALTMIGNIRRYGTSPMARFLVAGSSAGYDRYNFVTFTGNGSKAVSAIVHFAGEVGHYDLRLTENISFTTRLSVSVTWAADGTAVAAATTGNLLRFESLGGGFYLLEAQAVGINAAVGHVFYAMYPTSTAGVDIGAMQVEDSAFPTSYVATGSAIVTRAADQHEQPFPALPQAMTIYLRFVERGAVVSSTVVFSLGGVSNNCVYVTSSGITYAFVYKSGGVQHDALAAVAPVFGDVVELRCILNANGSTQLGQSINGGAEVLTALQPALALPGAWASAILSLCSLGAGGSALSSTAFERIVAQPGAQSLAFMRTLAQ